MADDLVRLLKNRGPSLSTDLAKDLVKTLGLTPEAARKRISRPTAGVKRLAYLPFPRNVRFLYLQADFGSPQYWNNLIQALLTTKSAYGLALAALRQRGGIMPTKHFPIACGAPLRQKRHLSPETILDRLKTAQLVGEYDIAGIGSCVALLQGQDRYDEGKVELRARLLVEGALLKATSTWLKHLAIVSFGKITTRDSGSALPQVGTFAWDLSAPSYLNPMLQWTPGGDKKPGFVACDVLLGIEVDEAGLRPFINKCVTLRSLKNVGRCLQIFIADHFEKKAFDFAKQNGIIPATPETLFGKEVADGLVQLFELLCTAANFSVEPDVFNQVFESLSQIEGVAVNLRGALFEYLVAEIVRRSSSSFVRMARTYKLPTGEKIEVDVVAEQQNISVTFIECKGYQPSGTLPDQQIERWLTRTIPRLYDYARNHSEWQSLKIHFELWTTANVSTDAQNLVNKASAHVRPTKYTLALRDVGGVREIAKTLKDMALLKIFNEHFFEHPLAAAERDLARHRIRRARSLASTEMEDPLVPPLAGALTPPLDLSDPFEDEVTKTLPLKIASDT